MDDQSPDYKNQEQTGSDSFFKRLYRPGPLILMFSIVFIIFVALGLFLLTSETPPPPVILSPPVGDENISSSKVYQEKTNSYMEDKVKQADLSIIETLRDENLDLNELEHVDVEMRRSNERGYHFQVLRIPSVVDRVQFLNTLRYYLNKRVPEAALLDNRSNEAAIRINELPTHRLLLESIPMKIPSPESQQPKLAIVIDDIGEDHAILKGLLKLDIPLTFAVWPNASHTRASVELICEKRRDLIIHFPMEPKGYPEIDPGDDALFVSMTKDEIKKRVAENLSKIPEAIGVNNHMGSRFTSFKSGMDIALAEFKRSDLFFLDSMTSPKSSGKDSARSVGIAFYERDIFLDNVRNVNSIEHQLKKAEHVAFNQGYAIAIGHPYPETLTALKQWNANRDKIINIIPISNLFPKSH